LRMGKKKRGHAPSRQKKKVPNETNQSRGKGPQKKPRGSPKRGETRNKKLGKKGRNCGRKRETESKFRVVVILRKGGKKGKDRNEKRMG